MPNLNRHAQAAMGKGSGPGSVDTVLIANPGGESCWLDDHTVILQTLIDGHWAVCYIDLDDPSHTPHPMTDPVRGANEIYAGGGRWLGFLSPGGMFGSIENDKAVPRGAGSDGTLAYCRDYQSGLGLVLNAPDGSEFDVPNAGFTYHVQVLGPRAAVWFDGANVQAYGIPAPRPALKAGRLRRVVVGTEVWLVYWHNVDDALSRGLIAQIDGALDGYILNPNPTAFYHDANCPIGTTDLAVKWSYGSGEYPSDYRGGIVDRTQPRVVLHPVTPPVEEPIGPRSDPRPANDLKYDLLTYILGNAGTWPRGGPTHPMNQYLASDRLFHFVKFNNPEAYETWSYDVNWIYHLEDASSEPYSFSDPRWFPRTMQIGEAHGFNSGEHTIDFHHRYVCDQWRRDPVVRRMWLQSVYDKWYWGKDFGERQTIVIAYDPSASRINSHGYREGVAGRNIELGFYALGAGSCRWDSYPSLKVYPGNSTTAVFHESDIEHRSDFYLLGGNDIGPKLTTCVKQACPHLPPWNPTPTPEPPSPFFHHTEVTMQSIDGKIGVLRGIRGEVISPGAPGTGIWGIIDGKPSQWRDNIWKSDAAGVPDECRYLATKLPNGRYTMKNVAHDCFAGEDAGPYSPGIDKQIYHKPTGNTDAGDLEQWRVYDGNQNGAIECQVEQATDDGRGKKFFAYPLSFEVL